MTKVPSIHVTRKDRDFKRASFGTDFIPPQSRLCFDRPLYSNLIAPISRIMDSSTSTVTVFVVTADIRSERRIDLHTTVGQLKVRIGHPGVLFILHFASFFNL